MMKNVFVLSFLFLLNSIVFSQNNIVKYKYWFDSDFGNSIETNLTPSGTAFINTSINASNLSDGIHILNIQFTDDLGWNSGVVNQFFYKNPFSISLQNEIIGYEYWIDNLYSGATFTSVSPSQQVLITDLIDYQSIGEGIHTFNIRVKDGAGHSSSTVTNFFYKLPVTSIAQKEIIAYQYWYDDYYSQVTTVNLSAQQQFSLIDVLPAQSLSIGAHRLNVRFKDNSGSWSSVVNQYFFRKKITNTNNYINEYRYWIGDSNDTTYVSVSPAVATLSINENLDLTQVTKGDYTIHFQFKDTLNQWSVVTTDTIEKISFPIADFLASDTIFCDSGTVSFDNLSIDGDIFEWNFGDGDTGTDSLPVHHYNAPGIYNVSLTTTDTTVLIDSTKTIQQLIHVYETPNSDFNPDTDQEICEGTDITLSSSATNAVYDWSTGEITNAISVDQEGDYWLTVSNINNPNCIGNSDTISITLNPLPVADFSFAVNGLEVVFTNNSSYADNFEWNFDDGNTSVLQNVIYEYTQFGSYNTSLVAFNQCGSDTVFQTLELEPSSVDNELNSKSILLYPNPNNGQFFIKLPDNEVSNVIILNTQGKKVFDFQGSSLIKVEKSFSPGIYFIYVNHEDVLYRSKFSIVD